MAVSYISPRIYATTDAGAPAVGYKLYTYLTGTSTPATTYSDDGGLSANANPVVLNARGEAVVFLTSGTTYRFVLKTDADVSVWTQDSIVGATSDVLSSNVTVSGAAVVPNGPLNGVLDDNKIRISTLEAGVATLGASASPVQGSVKALAISATGLSASVAITCDQVVLYSTTTAKRYSTVSVTASTAATGAGGLDTGTISTSTWYSLWLIGKSDGTITGLLSTSATSPTLPTGYDYKARVGWIRTDSTASKYPLGFTQKGRKVRYLVAAGTNLTAAPTISSGSSGTPGSSLTAVPVTNYVPTTAASIVGQLYMVSAGNQTMAVQVSPNSNAAFIGGAGSFLTQSVTTSYANQGVQFEIMLESSSIYYAGTPSGGSCGAVCLGWEDNL